MESELKIRRKGTPLSGPEQSGIKWGSAPRIILCATHTREEREMRFDGVHTHANFSSWRTHAQFPLANIQNSTQRLAQRRNAKAKAGHDHTHNAEAAAASTGRLESYTERTRCYIIFALAVIKVDAMAQFLLGATGIGPHGASNNAAIF